MKQEVANSTYNNDWFRREIGASRFRQIVWYFVNALFFINPLSTSSGLKRRLLRAFGAKIGTGAVLKPGVNIKYPWKLEIGEHTWIGEKVWIDNLAVVRIGSNACLSQGAFLLTGNHDYTSPGFDLMIREIVLEDGVWIGAKAIVGPGVTCCSHAVLTAGSVATDNLGAYGIYRGNPATWVRERIIHSTSGAQK
jgi:putative colanic acid biosynthesis acetyltransferase WcaF